MNDDAWGHDGPDVDPTDYQFSYVSRHKPTAKKRSGATPEAKVLRACIDYLELIGCYVNRTGAGLIEVDGRTIRMGRTGGLDLTCCTPHGCYLAVDAKSATGKPSDGQLKQRELIEARGGVALFPRSKDELRAGLCAAYGPQRIAQWEVNGRARQQAHADEINDLKRKMGQK